jgi:hypothetical protein
MYIGIVPVSTPASIVLAYRRLNGYLQRSFSIFTNVIEGRKNVVLAGKNDSRIFLENTANSMTERW